MINRFVLVGLAAAGLAAPAAAAPSLFDNEAPAASPGGDLGEPATGESATETPKRHVARKPRPQRVSVLPPLRPAFEEAAGASSAPGEIAVAVPDVPSPAPVGAAELAAAPPIGDVPVQGVAAADPAVSETAPGRRVAVLPPLRPRFRGEEADGVATAGQPAQDPGSAAAQAAAETGPEIPVRLVRVLPPARPAFRADRAFLEAAVVEPPAEQPQPEAPRSLFGALFGAPVAAATAIAPAVVGAGESVAGVGRSALNAMIALHARANGVPEDLVHRVVIRESKYNPRAVGHGGALGLMQIKHSTARALGYAGPASGLLDANTNLTYAVKYLAGAYRTADGNYDQAVRYYARGYYYAQKAHTARYASGRRRGHVQEADASASDPETTAR